jgi:hypothetical protein
VGDPDARTRDVVLLDRDQAVIGKHRHQTIAAGKVDFVQVDDEGR